MKIVEQTPTRLIAQARPDKRRVLFAGGLLAVTCGFLILLLTDSVVVLTCQRSGHMQGKIELVSSRLTSSRSREVPLDGVTGVAIRQGVSRGGGGVVLETGGGDFSLASLSGGRANELAAQLVAFLSDHGPPDLVIRQDTRWSTYGVASGMIVVGLFIIALGFESVACIFDKQINSIAVVRKGLFGTRRAEYQMSDAADVAIERVGNRKRAKVLYLVLKSGARAHAGWPGDSDAIGTVRRFLGLNGERRDEKRRA